MNVSTGEPGCGPTQFLIKMQDYVAFSLEDNRSAVILTSMDYSKAFNRLRHSSCLSEFVKKGASSQMIAVIAGFLKGRTMSVRIGQVLSVRPKAVHVGAPQGSVLGSFLFNVGIDTIQDGCQYQDTDIIDPEHSPRSDAYPAASTLSRVFTTRRALDLSPIREDGPTVEILPRAANVPCWLRKPKDPRWVQKAPENLNYIDDGAHLHKVNMRKQRLLIRNGEHLKLCHDPVSQAMFDHVTRRAEERGMLVNEDKTGLICLSAAVTYKPRAVIYGKEGSTIESKDQLKLLGFTIDMDGGCRSHVNAIILKIRWRTWALHKLKRYGFSAAELGKVYVAYMRPIVEYVSVAWHSCLTAEQAAQIEKQQTHALRLIHGYGPSAKKLRERSNIELLSSRRERACSKFARKTLANPRFANWFKERVASGRGRRDTGKNRFYEPTARTDRYRNSPLNYLTRKLNRDG